MSSSSPPMSMARQLKAGLVCLRGVWSGAGGGALWFWVGKRVSCTWSSSSWMLLSSILWLSLFSGRSPSAKAAILVALASGWRDCVLRSLPLMAWSLNQEAGGVLLGMLSYSDAWPKTCLSALYQRATAFLEESLR